MSTWGVVVIVIAMATIVFLFCLGENLHRDELENVHKMYKAEREDLLNRIMANNIHEYQSAAGKLEVKRSETGNYLKDRMAQAAKQYKDLE
jgi:hypothetical protein